jgi:hypothetical protein
VSEYNGKFMVDHDPAAAWQHHHAVRSQPAELPQLFSAGRALAVQRAAAGGGPVTPQPSTRSGDIR